MWLSERLYHRTLHVLYDQENKKKKRDFEGFFVAVYKTFSQVFDCTLHGLLLAKLLAYGFDKILNYILTWVDRNKNEVGCTLNELMSILFDVPKGSALGPLLFIIYICDMFNNDHIGFRSYADDTTAFAYGGNLDQILDELEKHVTKISK